MKIFLTSWRFTPVDYIALAMSVGMIAAFIMHNHAGRWEGQLFPVVVDTELTSVRPANDFQTDIEGITTKIRDCEWIETEIWAGPEGSSMRMHVDRPEGTTNFGLGRHPWSTMRIHLPVTLTTSNVAITHHRCHSLWLTETRLFGPETPRPRG